MLVEDGETRSESLSLMAILVLCHLIATPPTIGLEVILANAGMFEARRCGSMALLLMAAPAFICGLIFRRIVRGKPSGWFTSRLALVFTGSNFALAIMALSLWPDLKQKLPTFYPLQWWGLFAAVAVASWCLSAVAFYAATTVGRTKQKTPM